jgi:cellulose synthase/poly-beta-1,6-N-acetylglucosamine synthase-like glycosyltransferase
MKVLCFTTSYKRPFMLRQCIMNIKGQRYSPVIHSINIAYDNREKAHDYVKAFDDIIDGIILSFNANADQHDNYLNAVKAADYSNYDIFVKIDDDDIYKRDYIGNIVETMLSEKCDVCSSATNYLINKNELTQGIIHNLGDLPSKIKFNMPSTYAFNKKALDLIINEKFDRFEDVWWRGAWESNDLKHSTVNNENNFIYHMHGNNISKPE